ncbi:porin [Solemya velum gill symbiont]|uniref:porin n=1 Tax=Solemya velum gill symbiont TaxID=2340 RepID=UPI000997317C|nr:porin [Solemya velum gill symbiont]OOZ42931.1 hypothetical protein BOW37_12580 [Solemya velum gill symbiont]OOZ43811.1 hypothetical protein BOW38_12175 [Solemya velum gill symbiont]OOZ48152.1 hypothetical protein BOW39_12160 [Solemya velum gill symbiont]OOZ48868.1 hypothetical protein BOW40_12360 [Solemya velum gill symbiont]OOZ52827.1 hypothetical protein BOW41_12320 [Solemya velum gill symbiont]
MKKGIIAAAVAAAIAAPAANAGVTIYGQVHVSIDSVDMDVSSPFWYDISSNMKDQWEVNSRGSRIGFKGSEDLGNGMKAIWLAESGYDFADGGAWASSTRQSYLGLAGDWGTFTVGRQYTPYKVAMMGSGIENMGDTAADTSSLANISNQGSVSNAIAYVSPSMNGLTAAVAIVPGEGSGGNDGLADTISAGLIYSANGLYLGASYQTANASGDDPTWWGLSASYTMNNLKIAAIYEDMSDGATVLNVNDFSAPSGHNSCDFSSPCTDGETWAVSATYTMGNNALKATYGHHQNNGGDDGREQTGWGVGGFHSFSKRTQAYVVYSSKEYTDNNDFIPFEETIDTDTISVGMIHKF